MLKTLLAAAALVTVAAAPANAGFTLNGFTLNGVQFQGVQFNGMRLGPIGMNVGGHGGASLNGQVIAIEL